jgi:hypothetical protein
MPTEDGVRRHERRDLREYSTTQSVSQFSQASPLTVFEPQAPCQPRLQDPILLPQERDDVGLIPKAAISNWNGSTCAVYAIDPVVGHYGVHTSVVKKSAATSAGQCARRNVFQLTDAVFG